MWDALRKFREGANDESPEVAPTALCVAENGGTGEDPPPMGSLMRVDAASREKRLIAKGLQDPVWLTSDGSIAYVGLFHAGTVVRVKLADGSTNTVASGLSCPEGVALGGGNHLFVVENPVGDECRGANLTKAARLTRIDLASGAKTEIAGLLSPHGLAVDGDAAFVCEWGAHQLTRVDLASGSKVRVAGLSSPSGCAVGGGYAYAVEQGDPDGQLVNISLTDGTKSVMLAGLAGPMGVAVGGGYAYVGERQKNRVRRVALANGATEVFAGGFDSPIGLAPC